MVRSRLRFTFSMAAEQLFVAQLRLIGKLDGDMRLLGFVQDLSGGCGVARLNVFDAEDSQQEVARLPGLIRFPLRLLLPVQSNDRQGRQSVHRQPHYAQGAAGELPGSPPSPISEVRLRRSDRTRPDRLARLE